jgi:MFS family permease
LRRPFYGWIIVAVGFLISFTESGVFQNILSIFMKPMVSEFGWSRASVTGAISFGSVSGGLLSLAVGPVLDRYGPRMVGFWGILFLSLGLVAMTFVESIWQLYLFFGVGRMIAVGVLGLAVSVSVANWFVRHRGRAMGIARIGDRLGGALLPLMVQFFILAIGWRLAWSGLGIVVFLMSGIPTLIFLRHRPEDMGLRPDGALPPVDKGRPADTGGSGEACREDPEPVWTRSQATRTKTFWTLTFVCSLIPFAQAGVNFHIFPFLTDQGFEEATAIWILTAIAVSGMVGSPLWGALAERFRIQSLLVVNVAGSGLIFLLFYWGVLFRPDGVMGLGAVLLLAVVHGTFHGGRIPMIPIIWADFFGRRSMGSIFGLANPIWFTANAIGPVFAGLCFDLFGNYAIPFYAFVAVYGLSAAITVYLRPPRHPVQSP